jgi:hypothetical protein
MNSKDTEKQTQSQTQSSAVVPFNGGTAREKSVERKTRAKSLMQQLTPEQQVQLTLWLHEESVPDVMDKVAAPQPEGFGIRTHLTTLRRIKSQLFSADVSEDLETLTDLCHDVSEQSGSLDISNIQETILGLLHSTALRLAQEAPASDELANVLANITRLSTLEHKRASISIARQKLVASNLQVLPRTPNSTQHHRVDLNIVPLNSSQSLHPATIIDQPQPQLASQSVTEQNGILQHSPERAPEENSTGPAPETGRPHST